MPPATVHVLQPRTREAQYALISVALPGRQQRTVGVLVHDPGSGETRLKLRDSFDDIAGPEDAEVLAHLAEDLEARLRDSGGAELHGWMEETFSNVVRISEREAIACSSLEAALERLFEENVEQKAIPFVTHLPLYSLPVAAGPFGQDVEVEWEDLVKAPPGLRLTQEMFAARIVGHSMEPRIPDGSLCVFRRNVVGSRQGKLLLVELLGVTDTSARYTVKRYSSQKVSRSEEEWEHTSIVLWPLNPEFEPIELGEGDFRVIAEFVQVL